MKISVIAAVTVAGLSINACSTSAPTQSAASARPQFTAGDSVRLISTVEAIDRENRVLTMREPGGMLRRITVSSAMKNFDQIDRGDRVAAEYVDELAIYLLPPQDALQNEDATAMESAPPGRKPSGVAVETRQRIAVVDEIDSANRRVTFHDRDGRRQSVVIDPAAGNLNKLEPGAHIVVRYMRSLAIAVTKAAP